ncbi:hypothetical protein ACLK17_16610 [Escherichia coli]
MLSSLNLWLLYRLNLRLLGADVVPIFGGGVINIPELVFAGALPLTEPTVAGGFEVSEQPASHSETSDKAAMRRRTVNFGVPRAHLSPRNR